MTNTERRNRRLERFWLDNASPQGWPIPMYIGMGER